MLQKFRPSCALETSHSILYLRQIMEVVHVLVTSILNKLESLNVTALITLETRKMHKYTCKVQNLNFTNYSFKAGCVFFTMESYRNCVDFTLERKPALIIINVTWFFIIVTWVCLILVDIKYYFLLYFYFFFK